MDVAVIISNQDFPPQGFEFDRTITARKKDEAVSLCRHLEENAFRWVEDL